MTAVDAPPPVDEAALRAALDHDGYAMLPNLVDHRTCHAIADMYDDAACAFRSTVVMARHGFGRGEYRYFARPLPDPVQQLRETLYPPLARIATEWALRLGAPHEWPADHAALVEACAANGQTRPTPLLLRYGPGDYNRLHQDIYGDLVFPLQVAILLDAPGRDFEGGEFLLVENQPRMQSRGSVVPLRQGDAVVFPVRERPVRSARGWARSGMRHGVAPIRAGTRRTLGIIFHDAR